ncbi:MAG: beta-lactamase family protein, partial [Nannocystaceae bacterium]|nr:beta-lactamase family protein [Nannocystaceae bacterium]
MTWLWTILWAALAGPGASTSASAAAHIDHSALERELDTIVSEHIAGTGVPGVMVTVTSGSRIIVERGWGLADLDSGRPMDPSTTLVRIASLSKTFTATAVAQLEDAGRIELDADIDTYLQRVKTAGPFAVAVTLRHLLAHTSGFINFNSGRVSRQPLHPEDFESFMARTMPPRVYPPGTATLYSNHGNALAGLVVQDVARIPFAQYVADNI